MPLTEAQRRANRKYNAAHYTNISARVSLLDTVTAAGLTVDQFKPDREVGENNS